MIKFINESNGKDDKENQTIQERKEREDGLNGKY
jgi:hypothetical protein